MDILSNTLVVLGIVLGTALVVAAVVYFILPLLIKKNIPVNQYIESVGEVLAKADEVLKMVDGVMPNNSAVNIAEKIIKIAEVGVKNAEQLYKIGEIAKDQRKTEAINYINTVLGELGIEITPEREQIILGAIEAAVYAIGHKKESFTEEQITKLMSAPNEDIITDISDGKTSENANEETTTSEK